jgi:hypothetical protein
MEGRLERFGREPRAWADKLEACKSAIEDQLESPLPPAPWELAGGRSRVEAYNLATSLTKEYGRLLECWPDLVAAARTLKERGSGLSKPA